MNKIKQFFKENIFFIIFIVITFIICNYRLPYYIEAPGGTINIYDRIKLESKQEMKGTLNLLYVSSYDATIPTMLMSFILKDWDAVKLEEMQVSNESAKEINIRNKVMLDNSIQNAILIAYNKANKNIKINKA